MAGQRLARALSVSLPASSSLLINHQPSLQTTTTTATNPSIHHHPPHPSPPAWAPVPSVHGGPYYVHACLGIDPCERGTQCTYSRHNCPTTRVGLHAVSDPPLCRSPGRGGGRTNYASRAVAFFSPCSQIRVHRSSFARLVGSSNLARVLLLPPVSTVFCFPSSSLGRSVAGLCLESVSPAFQDQLRSWQI